MAVGTHEQHTGPETTYERGGDGHFPQPSKPFRSQQNCRPKPSTESRRRPVRSLTSPSPSPRAVRVRASTRCSLTSRTASAHRPTSKSSRQKTLGSYGVSCHEVEHSSHNPDSRYEEVACTTSLIDSFRSLQAVSTQNPGPSWYSSRGSEFYCGTR